MSIDSPYEKMDRHIAYGTGIYAVIVFWLFYLQGPVSGWFAPMQIIANSISDLLKIPTLTVVAFAIGYFLKYVGMHDGFDKRVFKAQKEVDKHINDRLRKYFDKKFKDRDACIVPEDSQLLAIFYEFTNKQQDSWAIQRALAFSYWIKYYLSMNLIILSIAGAAGVLVVDSFSGDFTVYSWIALGLFVVVGAVSVIVSQLRIRPKLSKNIANPQLDRIILDNREALDTMLKNRFTKDNDGLY